MMLDGLSFIPCSLMLVLVVLVLVLLVEIVGVLLLLDMGSFVLDFTPGID
jgi:hypothetical protein